jgi:DNA mismatch repair protein MutS2
MEDLLAALERKEKEASSLLASLDEERAEAARLRKELQLREADLRHREDSAEDRAREDARLLLLEARREVEAAIREVRRAGESVETGEDGLERATRRARRRVEEAARRNRPQDRQKGTGAPGPDPGPGDRVRLAGSGAEGRVVEVREGRGVVETGGVRFQVPAAEVEVRDGGVVGGAAGLDDTGAVAGGWQGPEGEVETEIDLRGLRVSEVDMDLQRALDQAVLVGLGEIRIIHGKGTGALRERVTEILSQDPRVKVFRLGQPGEGGAGITIVDLQ